MLSLHRVNPRLLHLTQNADALRRVLQHQHRHMRVLHDVAVAQEPLDRRARLFCCQSLHWHAAADRQRDITAAVHPKLA